MHVAKVNCFERNAQPPPPSLHTSIYSRETVIAIEMHLKTSLSVFSPSHPLSLPLDKKKTEKVSFRSCRICLIRGTLTCKTDRPNLFPFRLRFHRSFLTNSQMHKNISRHLIYVIIHLIARKLTYLINQFLEIH